MAFVERDEDDDSADEDEADDNDEAVDEAEELRSLAMDLSEWDPGASICCRLANPSRPLEYD